MSEVIEMRPDADHGRERWWVGPARIAVHIVEGTLVFGVIALAAIGLAFFTAWAETLTYKGIPVVGPTLIWGLLAGKYMLFAVDILLFARFLAKSAVRMWKVL